MQGRALLEGVDRVVSGERFEVLGCSRCGLAYTWPRPEDMARYYPSDSYYAYSAERDSAVQRARLWLIRSFPYREIARMPRGRLLDVGCGVGTLAASFHRHGWQVAGVEPSPEACRVAAGEGVEVHCGVIENAPWEGGSFDAVIFNHSFEHVPDPLGSLKRAHGLLRPGGLLGLTVPNFANWQRRRFGADWFQLDLPRHLQHFEPSSLAYVARRAGFDVVGLRSHSMLAGLPGSVQFRLFGRQRLNGRAGRAVAMALYPPVVLSDIATQGDCLNLVARRPG